MASDGQERSSCGSAVSVIQSHNHTANASLEGRDSTVCHQTTPARHHICMALAYWFVFLLNIPRVRGQSKDVCLTGAGAPLAFSCVPAGPELGS